MAAIVSHKPWRIGSLRLAITIFAAAAASDAHANLLVNGDFSSGNTGFSTDYPLVVANGTVDTSPPAYAVVSNPATAFTNGYDSYGDHTTGTGLMLFIDGSGSSSSAAWRETVSSLAAATVYDFSYFVTAAYNANLPKTTVLVNGSAIDTGFQVTGVGGGANWQKVSETFTTGAAGAYTISVNDLNTAGFGNDFTLDDFSLVGPSAPPPRVPEPGSVFLLSSGLLGMLGLYRSRAVHRS